MNISQFAKKRDIQTQTVAIYIRRHPELFEGLTTQDGKSIELSEEALEILNEVYPLQQPMEIENEKLIEELERTKADLEEARDYIIRLQKRLIECLLDVEL